MCALYLLGGLYVLITNIDRIPDMFRLIFEGAFSKSEAAGAFLGGTFGFAFLKGMQRALFSNEAGQGSAPIAHSAAKTDEPVREGVVAGLEPFIDTLVVCTITAIVILLSGVWNRDPALQFDAAPRIAQVATGEGGRGVDDRVRRHLHPPGHEASHQINDGQEVLPRSWSGRSPEQASRHKIPGRLVRGPGRTWTSTGHRGPSRASPGHRGVY
jgi:hypothetical protein